MVNSNQKNKVCGECSDGHNVDTGSVILVKCGRQSGLRALEAACNLESLPRKEMELKK